MKEMRINEIFYSLQGEGRFTGTPAVLIRFSGCNLACPFCDTDFKDFKEMSEEEIIDEIGKYPTNHIVITGGEPLLQLTASLVDKLHEAGKFVQVETNGTQPAPEGCDIDWITCSPKYRPVILDRIDELKVVYKNKLQDMDKFSRIEAKVYSLQPCDTGNKEDNARLLKETIDFCLAHPKWHLSLQTHKIADIR